MTQVPKVKLNNGTEIPVFGLGTWQGVPGQENEVSQAVKDAIDLGYRLFDCAHVYCNEKAIGQAIQDKIKEGVVSRKDLFITSKLWCTCHRPDLVEPALNTTLKNLQLDYIDLYLIHWPLALLEVEDELHPKGKYTEKYLYSDVDYVDTWRAMEQIYRKNLAGSIGVSNFNSLQINRILNICTVFPQINQVECHPFLNQNKLRKFCDKHGIIIMSYRPLGGPRSDIQAGDLDVLNDDRIQEIAQRYEKTPAQILLKYNLQLGNIVIPKSSNKNRLAENINIFDFYLAPEDMSYLNTFDCNGRTCRFDEVKDHVFYPFRPSIEF